MIRMIPTLRGREARPAWQVLRHLLDKGVRPSCILLHGHSMGGGVATQLRKAYPGACAATGASKLS